jgi:origin recognition complex subunit 6
MVHERGLEDDAGAMDGVEMTTQASGITALAKTEGSNYIGLGTMFQEATDYLGHRQRDDFQRWRARIMNLAP